MANWTVLRGGQVNQSGASDAIFLKLYSGEVLTTYQTECVMDALVKSRNITGGKSAQFVVTGRVAASYHVVGTEMVGQNANQNEIVILVDDLLTAPVSISNIDEAKSQYDFRSQYTIEAGRALAREKDSRLLRTGILAARATGPISEQGGGNTISDPSMKTDKTVLITALQSAAQKFDELNVPSEDRYAVVPPSLYYLLLNDDRVVNKFYDVGGSVRDAEVPGIWGIDIKKSNQVPSTIVAGVTGENNTYSGNFTTTAGLVFQKEAIGTVNLLGLSTEMEYSVSRQSTLVVAKYACGHGVLRAANAIELVAA